MRRRRARTRGDGRGGRFSRPQPIRIRLRTDAARSSSKHRRVQPRLIVTVDNGIASHDGVAAAAARGIEVLITDHHLPAATLPAPALIVNPNQPGCAFPGKHLAGVGVMFYVLMATRALLRERGAFAGRGGTQSRGAARPRRARHGRRRRAPRPRQPHARRARTRAHSRRALPARASPRCFAAAGRDARRATAYDLGFVAGPRLNAAGRLADMTVGIRCLLADTAIAALPLATELDRLNRERRDVEATMQEEALAEIEARGATVPETRTRCVSSVADWHQGVVGIVASRLKDRYHRPAIVFARGTGGELKGSGRSIPGIPSARRARSRGEARARRDRPLRRSRVRGGPFAGRSRPAEIRRRLRGGRARSADAGAISPAFSRRTAASSRPSSRSTSRRRWPARSGARGFPRPPSTTSSTLPSSGSSAASTRSSSSSDRRSAGPGRFAAILFNHADPLPATIRAVYRPDPNEWNGTVALQLVIQHWEAAVSGTG